MKKYSAYWRMNIYEINYKIFIYVSNKFGGWDKEVPETMPAYNFTLKAILENAFVVEPNVISISKLKERYTENNPIQINFWTGFGKDITEGLDQIIADFEAEYHYYIDIVHESKGGYSGLTKAINLAITTRKYPQVALGYPDHFAQYIYNGIQCDLSGYINSSDPDLKIDINDFNSDFLKENLELAYKNDDTSTPYIMGLPFNKSTEVTIQKSYFKNKLIRREAILICKQCKTYVFGREDRWTSLIESIEKYEKTLNREYEKIANKLFVEKRS